jgi:DNA polymerase-3 subunit epsilon
MLYNESARRLLTASDGASSGSAGYMGIGRSLYALMHKESVEHALGQLRARVAAGTGDPVTTFATAAASGTMLRARIAPVAGAATGGPADAGYVLLLEDLSRELSALEQRDALLTNLVEQSRAALASARAATENLASQPDMPMPLRSRFLGIAQDELERLTRLVEVSGAEHAAGMNRRPDLEPMRLAELMEAVSGKVGAIPGV